MKRAKDDLLEKRVLVSRSENFFKWTATFFSTMARISREPIVVLSAPL
jgi:hypothetical protein